MNQVHKRLTIEQVKVPLKRYCQGLLERSAIEEVLGIGRSKFFALLNEYRKLMWPIRRNSIKVLNNVILKFLNAFDLPPIVITLLKSLPQSV